MPGVDEEAESIEESVNGGGGSIDEMRKECEGILICEIRVKREKVEGMEGRRLSGFGGRD